MFVFEDCLSLFPHPLKLSLADGGRRQETAELLEHDSLIDRPGLYLGYVSTFQTCTLAAPRCDFILASDQPMESFPSGSNVLIIDNTDDLFTLLRQLNALAASHREHSEERMLLDTLLLNNDLQQLCEKSAAYLNNPILITDSAYNILAYSHQDDLDDDVWKTGWKRGYLTFEFIAVLTGEQHRYFQEDPSQRCLIVEGISPHRRKVWKCQMNESFLGYLILLEYSTPLTSRQEEKEAFVNTLIAKQLSMKPQSLTPAYRKKELSLIADLLDNRIGNQQLFQQRLAATSLQEFPRFQTFVINMTAFQGGRHVIQDQLRQELENRLQHSFMLPIHNEIVILTGFFKDNHANLNALQEFLKIHRLKAGSSDSFCDLILLPDYYQQAANALRFQQFDDSRALILDYGRIRLFHLLSQIPARKLPQFCDPDIVRLAQSDKATGTEYFKTLMIYLKTHGSLQKTAAQCYVHRNTIAYRIEKIRELFQLDPEDEEKSFRYTFSCLILDYLQHNPAVQPED